MIPVCAFHIGYPGSDCTRCGATWQQHVAATLVRPKGAK